MHSDCAHILVATCCGAVQVLGIFMRNWDEAEERGNQNCSVERDRQVGRTHNLRAHKLHAQMGKSQGHSCPTLVHRSPRVLPPVRSHRIHCYT